MCTHQGHVNPARGWVRNGSYGASAPISMSSAASLSGPMTGDLVAEASECHPGQPLLKRFIEHGRLVRCELLVTVRAGGVQGLGTLPAELRDTEKPAGAPYPVTYAKLLLAFSR